MLAQTAECEAGPSTTTMVTDLMMRICVKGAKNIPRCDHNCSSIDFHRFHVMDSTSGSKTGVNDTLFALWHLEVSAGNNSHHEISEIIAIATESSSSCYDDAASLG